MSKYKTTQKDAKNSNTVVLAVPYCFLQYALNHESPTAYNAGNDGWNFDLYDIDSRYSIITGYRTTSRASTHDLSDYPEMRAELKELDQACFGRSVKADERKERLIQILNRYLAD